MSLWDLVRFAGSALRGHRLRSVLSTLGVAIGVSSVLLLTALGEGARVYVTGELSTLGSNLIIVLPGKVETSGAIPAIGGTPNDLTLEDAQSLQRRIPLVRELAPLTFGQAEVSYSGLSRNVNVLGTTSGFLPLRRLALSRGSFLPAGEMTRGSTVCVIGSKVQQTFPRNKCPRKDFTHW